MKERECPYCKSYFVTISVSFMAVEMCEICKRTWWDRHELEYYTGDHSLAILDISTGTTSTDMLCPECGIYLVKKTDVLPGAMVCPTCQGVLMTPEVFRNFHR